MSSVPCVGFQGEPGAFSDEAARLLVAGADTRGYRTFDDLVAAVDVAEVDLALLPVENSIYGAIARAYDLLWDYPVLRIVDEIVFAVVQNLIGMPTATLADIREVRSHPVALEQVRRLFETHPEWRRIVVDDTAAAVAQVVELGDKTIAAIARHLPPNVMALKCCRPPCKTTTTITRDFTCYSARARRVAL